MLIDWFTVAAQLLNFLVLGWLLKRFLYRPIRSAIEVRALRVSTELADATAKRSAADAERDDLQSQKALFDAQRSELFELARGEASAERARLFEQVQEEADASRTTEQRALAAERVRLGNDVSRLVQREAFGIARKALADLTTLRLEVCIAEVFSNRLCELEASAKAALSAALDASSGPVVVRSTFELPAEQKASIERAFRQALATDTALRFEVARDALAGIELSISGLKVSWSIADYLSAMEQAVGALVSEPALQSARAGRRGTTREPNAEQARAEPTTTNGVHAEAE
jgi:F-type H+-transporting ATPase subunit b